MKRRRVSSCEDDQLRPSKRKLTRPGVHGPDHFTSLSHSKYCFEAQIIYFAFIIESDNLINPEKVYRDQLCVKTPRAIRSQKLLKGPHNVEKSVLKRRNKTAVTPKVGAIAQRLFLTYQFNILKMPRIHDSSEARWSHRGESAPVHEDDPAHVEWVKSTRVIRDFYRSVKIDGIVYSVRTMSRCSL